MTSGFSTLAPGMAVLGADAHHVGRVKAVHENDFVLGRTLQPTVHVPLNAVQAVTDKGVVLTVTAGDVDEMFWVHAGEDFAVHVNNLYD